MAVKTNNQPAPQRQAVLTFASPAVADILFYETIDGQRIGTAVPEYGTPHPDRRKWPNHKLVFIQNDDETGQMLRYYYAADREAQEAYNYELAENTSVTRTYVIPRDDYPASLPIPVGGTPDSKFPSYGFVGDSIADIGDVLRGHYVAIQRRFEPIVKTDSQYDDTLETNKTATTTIKPFDYELEDDDLESGNGMVYEVRYVNEYHSLLIASEAGILHPLQRKTVLQFATPSIADILFYEVYDTVEAAIPAYGTAHPDTVKWPNHKLIFVQPEEGSKGHLQRFYYAADRASQDAYNYELTEGLGVTRTYVVPRASYPSVLAVPVGGEPDSVFTSYGFVSDSLLDAGQPLNGQYIVVQRKYEPIVKTEIQYEQNLEMNVVTTTTIKPFNYQLSVGEVSGPGVVYEVKYVNQYHSLLVKNQTQTVFGPSTYVELDSVWSAKMYTLPNILTSYSVNVVWAAAFSTDPPDYSETVDFIPMYSIRQTSDGPWPVQTRRFLTSSPQAVVVAFGGGPRLPTPREDESVTGLIAKWWVTPNGVETVAQAREFPVPRAIHGAIFIPSNPHVYIYNNLIGTANTVDGTWFIDADTKEVGLNLYEVSLSYLLVSGA